MSGPRVRQMFVFLLLGTAIIFIFTGFFAMMRAKQNSRSSDIGRFTSGLSAETMVERFGPGDSLFGKQRSDSAKGRDGVPVDL